MNLTVDFSAGTSFQDACAEAKDFAIKMNLGWVKFNFNGISCSISKKCDIDSAYEKFLKVLEPGSEFKFMFE